MYTKYTYLVIIAKKNNFGKHKAKSEIKKESRDCQTVNSLNKKLIRSQTRIFVCHEEPDIKFVYKTHFNILISRLKASPPTELLLNSEMTVYKSHASPLVCTLNFNLMLMFNIF